jgi:homoaconitase/3-isopropylmalate dehydratase large subunit
MDITLTEFSLRAVSSGEDALGEVFLSEKILAAHCGEKAVEPGEFIEPKVDIALANDVTAPLAVKEFKKSGAKKSF